MGAPGVERLLRHRCGGFAADLRRVLTIISAEGAESWAVLDDAVGQNRDAVRAPTDPRRRRRGQGPSTESTRIRAGFPWT